MSSKYPRGKLNADDEGQLAMAIAVHDRTVIINFAKPVHWLGLSADDARALAALLLRHARSIDGRDPCAGTGAGQGSEKK